MCNKTWGNISAKYIGRGWRRKPYAQYGQFTFSYELLEVKAYGFSASKLCQMFLCNSLELSRKRRILVLED